MFFKRRRFGKGPREDVDSDLDESPSNARKREDHWTGMMIGRILLVYGRFQPESEQACLQELLHVLHSAWSFSDIPGDNYQPIAHLHQANVAVLVEMFSFRATDGMLIAPQAHVASFLAAVGRGIVMLEMTLHGASEDGMLQGFVGSEELTVSICDANGFGWRYNFNTVPMFSKVVDVLTPVVLLWNAMTMDAGVATVGRGSSAFGFSSTYMYGEGIGVLVKRSAFTDPRKVGDLRTDAFNGIAIMLSYAGPCIIAVHVGNTIPRDGASILGEWLIELRTMEVPSMLVINGDRGLAFAPMLSSTGWTEGFTPMTEADKDADFGSRWYRGCNVGSSSTESTMGVKFTAVGLRLRL